MSTVACVTLTDSGMPVYGARADRCAAASHSPNAWFTRERNEGTSAFLDGGPVSWGPDSGAGDRRGEAPGGRPHWCGPARMARARLARRRRLPGPRPQPSRRRHSVVTDCGCRTRIRRHPTFCRAAYGSRRERPWLQAGSRHSNSVWVPRAARSSGVRHGPCRTLRATDQSSC